MSTTKRGPNSPLTSLHRLEFILQQKSDTLLRQAVGVGFGQVQILQALHRAVPKSQRAVASELYQTEANISRQLQLLKRSGLVSVQKHPKDKRLRQVSLTAKGDRLVEKAQSLLADQHKQLLTLLNKSELQTFDQTVQNLLRAL